LPPSYSIVTWLFASGRSPSDDLLAPHLGVPLDQPMAELDGQRHQVLGLAAGEAEHHALVARALAAPSTPIAMSGLCLFERDEHGADSSSKPMAPRGVPDLDLIFADDVLDIDVGVGA
jgi:hypothetical protein